ncbi:uncharacterized protein LOC109510239 isoform X2 [Hippocampus comes]|uniref:uncharacterized protein LOC109510239 isoform X2 n=1 Tax=Hippocampus comes TaxID=109280 RepID=UPI00094F394D|nr:PREDICTED: zinc finger protein 804A isoform X2 [Hippocampus comes]
MACYYIVISSTHLRDGQLRSIKGVFRGPIGAGGHKNNQTDEGASSSLYCELCDKQYVRQQQFDNHINSYDHHHKQRLKELKQREFHRAAACRRQREERRDERRLRKRLRHRSQREDKADERRALGSGPMFRSTTVAVEPASATEKGSADGSHGVGAPLPDPQNSPRLPPDAAPGSNANTVTPGDITPKNGAAGRSGAFRKLPWATSFFSDAMRANNNNNNNDEPANSENKASVANRGRPVCFSLPKRSCVLLHRAAAVFIQAGRSSRDSETATRDEKQISSTPRVRARTRELDDKMKGILSLCEQRRGTGAQVRAGGGTAAQDGSGSRLAAQVSGGRGNQDVQVIDGRLTGAQSSTGDQIKAGGMTRAQNSCQSLTVQLTGGSGTWAEDGSRTDAPNAGECGPGARTGAPSCGQTAPEVEVTRGSDGSRTGVQLAGPSATTGAHLTGARDLGGTGAVLFGGLGARVVQESGGIRTGAPGTWQSGAAVEIMLRCVARDQDGARVAVGSATGDEGSRQNETGTQKGGGRRTGTGAENGMESLRSGTGSQPTHGGETAAGHRVTGGDPPPSLPLKCQSPGFETSSDKTDLAELRPFSTLAELQKAKPENQAQDLSPKQTPTSPPGRPSEPFCPVLSRDGSRVLLWPSEMVRRTRTSPSLSYGVNPLLYDFRAHARGRGQAAGGIKSAVIKRAGCQRKRQSGGGGGGEVKSDESRDENRGGQAGNPLQAADRGKGGKAGAALPHAHASKSSRAGLRRRRRRRNGIDRLERRAIMSPSRKAL